jgi:hypothetical protein
LLFDVFSLCTKDLSIGDSKKLATFHCPNQTFQQHSHFANPNSSQTGVITFEFVSICHSRCKRLLQQPFGSIATARGFLL